MFIKHVTTGQDGLNKCILKWSLFRNPDLPCIFKIGSICGNWRYGDLMMLILSKLFQNPMPRLCNLKFNGFMHGRNGNRNPF